MDSLYSDFDFSILEDKQFKEDSVREELIVPLLRKLGYSASGLNKIIRSKALLHPYVSFGTQKRKIYITPDYLLQINDINYCILDAKSPKEVIHTGKNVEQAYSYAIHKDVRVNYYALCNGYEFVLFHINKHDPLLYFKLQTIDYYWSGLEHYLGADRRSKSDPERRIKPDLGLHLLKLGLANKTKEGKEINNIFLLTAFMIAKLDENNYSINCYTNSPLDSEEEVEHLLTLDFDSEKYKQFLQTASFFSEDLRQKVDFDLHHAPFHHTFEEPEFCSIGATCHIGEKIYTNEDESYCPFVVDGFF